MKVTIVNSMFCYQLDEASLVTDLQALNEKIEQVEAVCLLYDTSAKESFRFVADLYVSNH